MQVIVDSPHVTTRKKFSAPSKWIGAVAGRNRYSKIWAEIYAQSKACPYATQYNSARRMLA
jgi:hypothetical protein